MEIIFITDLHTGQPEESNFQVDLRGNLLSLLQVLEKHEYDLLVIGGDLCLNEGRADIYEWQKAQFDKLGKPYYLIAGNHDDQKLMSRVFTGLNLTPQEEIYYEVAGQDFVMLFLDSGRKVLSAEQMNWMKNRSAQHRDKELLIFIHHPPSLMQVPFMDLNHALDNRSEVLGILTDHPQRVHVFSGHYHVHKSTHIRNVSIHVTPSLFIQIDQEIPEFCIDHKKIGYRRISVVSSKLTTSVHYLPGLEIGGD